MYVCAAHITCLDRSRLARCIAVYTNNVCSRDSVCVDEVTYNTTTFVKNTFRCPMALPWGRAAKDMFHVRDVVCSSYTPRHSSRLEKENKERYTHLDSARICYETRQARHSTTFLAA